MPIYCYKCMHCEDIIEELVFGYNPPVTVRHTCADGYQPRMVLRHRPSELPAAHAMGAFFTKRLAAYEQQNKGQ